MQLRRIFLPQGFRETGLVQITDKNICERLGRVLRLRVGERVRIFDGQGHEGIFTLEKIERGCVRGQVQPAAPKALLPLPEVWVGQALTKPLAKFESVLERCTELGASGFFPLSTQFTMSASLRAERLHQILISASEQCERPTVPVLHELVALPDFLQQLPAGETWVASEKEQRVLLREVLPIWEKAQRVNFLVGPEGGWSAEELVQLAQAGVRSFGLGSLILRTEEAAPAVLAALRLS